MDKEAACAARVWKKSVEAPESIHWTDLCQPPFRKHSQPERDVALQAGTLGNRPGEAGMIDFWRRPWLFWRVLWLGLLLTVSCALLVYGCQGLLHLTTDVAEKMLLILPPVVVPLALMIYFWELNVPKNISLWELMGFSIMGTLLSLGFNMALHFPLPCGGFLGALREELSKLAACGLLLLYCVYIRRKRIYGFTGLVIGAAVGSGFGAFETISYALSSDFQTVLLRSLFALAGHTMYTVSACAAMTLGRERGLKLFCSRSFCLSFLCAVFSHGLWNMAQVPLLFRFALTLALLWYNALWMTRKCFVEAAALRQRLIVRRQEEGSPKCPAARIELRCLRGPLAGKKWSAPEDMPLSLGRGSRNTVCLPEHTGGISRYHCRLFRVDGRWVLQDRNASYGTFVQMPGGPVEKLTSMELYEVKSGMLLYLGGQKNCFSITLY